MKGFSLFYPTKKTSLHSFLFHFAGQKSIRICVESISVFLQVQDENFTEIIIHVGLKMLLLERRCFLLTASRFFVLPHGRAVSMHLHANAADHGNYSRSPARDTCRNGKERYSAWAKLCMLLIVAQAQALMMQLRLNHWICFFTRLLFRFFEAVICLEIRLEFLVSYIHVFCS
jgi:hypothetical protein